MIQQAKIELFEFTEHSKLLKEKNFSDKQKNSLLNNLMPSSNKIEDLKFIGLNYDYKIEQFVAGYFIGLDWIEENKSAIIVTPKIPKLNYLQMFLSCFNCDEKDVRNKFKDIYHIDFARKTIKIPNLSFDLTPFLIVHFLKLTEALTKKGLKRDYISKAENLNSKIKGKIVFSQHLKKNLARGRQDRIFCRYQDYSVDCAENRIIKKTLLFVNSYLNKNEDISCKTDLSKTANSCLAVFAQVTDDISIQKIKQFKINPLYHEYAQTLKVAKLILKRFGYALENANDKIDNFLPPFWIDMALLFEIYVLSLLKNQHKGKIIYQAQGHYGNVDFLYKGDSSIIIDTKYKPSYSYKKIESDSQNSDREEDDRSYKIEDIRQLSGYARDKRIRQKLKVDDKVIIPCLIIFPLDNSLNDNEITKEIDLDLTKIDGISRFLEFYKFGIKLPIN